MKKRAIIGSIVILVLGILVITRYMGTEKTPAAKYMMDASIAYGSVDEESLDKTKVTYEMTISGEPKTIQDIDDIEVIFGEDGSKRRIGDGNYSVAFKEEEKPYVEVSGELVIDTEGMDKVAIDELDIIEGIRLVTKSKEETIFELHK
ncbi:MAG: hypothetical protein ACRCWY_02935 [Cellulosilyticaceae bacterium]